MFWIEAHSGIVGRHKKFIGFVLRFGSLHEPEETKRTSCLLHFDEQIVSDGSNSGYVSPSAAQFPSPGRKLYSSSCSATDEELPFMPMFQNPRGSKRSIPGTFGNLSQVTRIPRF